MANFPQVNLNGDKLEELLRQHHAVWKKALELADLMGKASPHGRNYQTLEHDAIIKARAEWLELLAGVKQVKDWADATITDLMRQGHDRHSSQELGDICLRALK